MKRMKNNMVLEMTKKCIKDIKDGAITEQEVIETLKVQGFDWYELKKAYQNLVKLKEIIKG